MRHDHQVPTPWQRLALAATDPRTRAAFEAAAARADLDVVQLPADPAAAVGLTTLLDTAFRAPGGYLAAVIQLGGRLRLGGAPASWFCRLDPSLTGRRWHVVRPDEAVALVRAAPRLVKLADGKHPALPARRYRSATELSAALQAVHAGPGTQLLTTETWLDIHSEYRVFTRSRTALTCAPYLVEDESWTPLLHTHRASFHDEAVDFAAGLLHDLAESDVPPAAVLDVARLEDGRFVALEANQPWSSGLYGCDPDAALASVLASNAPGAAGPDDRWLWTPDSAVFDLRWRGDPPG